MGSMSVIIHRIVIVANTVPTVNIVNIAITIIVFTIVGNLCRVYPNIVTEIKVIVVNTGVNNSNDNVRRTTGVPSFIIHMSPSVRNLMRMVTILLIVIRVAGNVNR